MLAVGVIDTAPKKNVFQITLRLKIKRTNLETKNVIQETVEMNIIYEIIYKTVQCKDLGDPLDRLENQKSIKVSEDRASSIII